MDTTTTSVFRPPCASDVADAVSMLVHGFNPVRIVLFGSSSRGDSHAGSDLDLLVVLPTVDNKTETAINMRHVLTDLPVPVDIVISTPEEIERRGWIVGTILHKALKEGVTVYETVET